MLIPVNRELVFTGSTWQPGEPAMTTEKQLQARESKDNHILVNFNAELLITYFM